MKAPYADWIHCSGAKFTMHLTPSGEGLDVIVGSNSLVSTGRLLKLSDEEPAYGLAEPMWVSTGAGNCAAREISLTSLTLTAHDRDEDGVIDSLGGVGTASGSVPIGDWGVSIDLRIVSWVSVPDTTRPELQATAELHPLDSATVWASEPLLPTTTLALRDRDGTEFPLVASKPPLAAVGMFYSTHVLPFQSNWTVTGSGADLGGIGLDLANATPATARVIDDPGLFAQDGFETPPNALISGEASVVSAVGTLAAISGNHSLLVGDPTRFNSSVTLHLRRSNGAENLRFTARELSTEDYLSGTLYAVEAGVIGGTIRVHADVSRSADMLATGDSVWLYAGQAKEYSLALTESGADVVVRISSAKCFGPVPLCGPFRAILIDDVQLE